MPYNVMYRVVQGAKKVVELFPYYHPAVTRARFKIDNENTSTMAIDCNMVITINGSFVEKLSNKELEGIILHEIFHYVYGHQQRYMNNPLKNVLPHSIHNIAMDLEINEFIDNLPDGSFIAKDFGLPPRKSYEEYLYMINSDMPKEMTKILEALAKGNVNGSIPIDDVSMDGYSEIYKEVLADLIHEMEAEKQWGSAAGSDDTMRDIKKKSYNWQQVFQNIVSTKVTEIMAGFRYRTYESVNRRHSHNADILFPKFIDYKRKISLIIIMDISGSMGDNVNKMYGIMKSMLDILDTDFSITVLEVNVGVENIIYNFDPKKKKIKSKDGGGTEMGAGLSYVYDNKLEADLIIVMTDSCTPWPDPPILADKTVVLTDNHDGYNGPYPMFPVYFD